MQSKGAAMTSKALEAAALALARKNFPDRKWSDLTGDQRGLYLTEATIAIRAFAENITDEMVEAFIATLHENQNIRGQNRQDAYRATTRAAILKGLE